MSVVENVKKVEDGFKKMEGHPMNCGISDDGTRFTMMVPPGFRVGAIRVDYSVKGKAWALEKLHEVAEREWIWPR